MPETTDSSAAPTIDAPVWMPTPMQRRLPNLLTLLRVVLAIGFFAVLTPWRYEGSIAETSRVDWQLLSAALMFIIAAVTDYLDGHLARKWNVVTVFGRVMDPFADKLLVVGASVYLAGPGFQYENPYTHRMIQVSGVWPWMVAVILGRELLVTSIRSVFEGAGVSFAATWSGKLKMILQSVAVPAIMVIVAVFDVSPRTPERPEWSMGRLAVDVLVWVTVAVTVWSGIPYVFRALAALRGGALEQTRRPTA